MIYVFRVEIPSDFQNTIENTIDNIKEALRRFGIDCTVSFEAEIE